MTTEQFWNRLDALAYSKDKTGSLVEAGELLRQAYDEDLPVLIAGKRISGKIQHQFTVFDEHNPDLQGNRYLVCYTSKKQATKIPVISEPKEHSDTVVFDADDDEAPAGKRKRKKKRQGAAWKPVIPKEIIPVSVRKVIDNMNKKRVIGGLLFNPSDEKNSLAIPKFLLN